eukprot:gene7343-5177_t
MHSVSPSFILDEKVSHTLNAATAYPFIGPRSGREGAFLVGPVDETSHCRIRNDVLQSHGLIRALKGVISFIFIFLLRFLLLQLWIILFVFLFFFFYYYLLVLVVIANTQQSVEIDSVFRLPAVLFLLFSEDVGNSLVSS